jgi:hypothetical protein
MSNDFTINCRFLLNNNDLLGLFDQHIEPIIEKEAETFNAYDKLIEIIKVQKDAGYDKVKMKNQILVTLKEKYNFTPKEFEDKAELEEWNERLDEMIEEIIELNF